MSSQDKIIEPQLTFSDLLDVRRSTVSGDYLDYEPSSLTLMQKLLDEEEMDDIGSEISQSVTVILKAITHRGTQTFIQCDPYTSKEEFINMMIHMKL